MRKIDKIIQKLGASLIVEKLISSLVLTMVISVSLYSQTQVDTVCNGEPITLRPTIPYKTIEWRDEVGNVLTTFDSLGVEIADTAPEVSPTVTTTYTAKIVNIGATNLIDWGDFESEPTPGDPSSFIGISSYKFFEGPDPDSMYVTTAEYNQGFFTVTYDPELLHDQHQYPTCPTCTYTEPWYVSMGDHTSKTGNMFAANGSTDPTSEVIKAVVPVDSGKTYIVSAWFANIHNRYSNPYKMDIYIDGNSIGNLEGEAVGGWYQHFSFWEATKTGNVDIVFKNTRVAAGGGNDFAIDDIVFAEVVEETFKVVAKDLPVVVVNDTSACYGEGIDKITTSVDKPIKSFTWTAPTGFLDDETVLEPGMDNDNQAPGTYEISLKVLGNNGCSGVDTGYVVIDSIPVVIVNDTASCQGEGISQITSSSTTPIQSVKWNDPSSILDDDTALVPAMADDNQAPGVYKLSLEVTSNKGCKGTSPEAEVTVVPNPVIVLEDQTSEVGYEYTFEVEVEGDTDKSEYLWTAPDGLMTDVTIKHPELADIDQEPGEYPIKFKVTNPNGCMSESDTKIYTVTALDTMVLEMPKAFMPTGDPDNSTVYVRGLGIKQVVSFQVFNRWGNLIFESEDKNDGWDGYYKGKLLPTGAYGYHVTVKSYGGKEYYLKGSILLLH